MKHTLKGVLFFHFENETEGGCWAFQDEKFITKNAIMSYCKKCEKYLDEPEYQNLKVTKILTLTKEVLEGKEPPECPDNEHERDVGDSWSYEGMHILENGDKLTVLSPEDPKKIIWSGIISLKEYAPFTENVSGTWIHADQNGVERETWAKYFFKEYPAKLKPIRKK